MDDVDLIIVAVEDSLEDILQIHGAKQESMYDRIEKDLRDIEKLSIQVVQCQLRLLQ